MDPTPPSDAIPSVERRGPSEVEYTLGPDDYLARRALSPGLSVSDGWQAIGPRVGFWVTWLVAAAVVFAFAYLVLGKAAVPFFTGGNARAWWLIGAGVLVLALLVSLNKDREPARFPPEQTLREPGRAAESPQRERVPRAGLKHPVAISAFGLTYRVAYEGLAEEVGLASGTETRAAWSAVERIQVTDRHVFITIPWVGNLIVPQAAFPDGATFRRFAARATAYHQAAAALPKPERTAGESAPSVTSHQGPPDERIME